MAAEYARTTEAHALELALHMRAADALECAADGLAPLEAVLLSVERSYSSVTVLVGGRVAAIFGYRLEGASMLGPRAGVVWALTTDAAELHPVAFHRAAKAWLAAISRHVDALWNWVDARYTKSLEWLRRLGFVVHAPSPRGVNGEPFCFVIWRA